MFQTVRATGVLPDIPSQRGYFLAGRVRGKDEPERRQGILQVQVDHAGLDHGPVICRINIQDAVHPAEFKDDAAPVGYGTTRQVGAGATGNDRYFVTVGRLYHPGHFGGTQREDDNLWHFLS